MMSGSNVFSGQTMNYDEQAEEIFDLPLASSRQQMRDDGTGSRGSSLEDQFKVQCDWVFNDNDPNKNALMRLDQKTPDSSFNREVEEYVFD